MKRAQLNLPIHEEMIVDNFAGGGGASQGIEEALARAVDVAINHDADALAMHAANHPETVHIPEDVWKVDPLKVTGGRPVGLAWFSPDCKDFSKAKGGKPVRKNIRGLAWIMVKWAAIVRPRVMFLENVEEFQDWGPLLSDNTRCPKRKGKTFRSFVGRLRNMGGVVEWKELRACDYGAPTIRKRLFLVVRFDGQPIVWPAPTHGKAGTKDVLNGRLKPWRTAAECIDFSLPCPSIFLTKEEAKAYGVKRPLVDATMRRIARGIMKFVVNNPTPFIVRVAHGQSADGGRVVRWGSGEHSINEPLGTVPASNEFAVVSPHVTKFRTGATGHEVTEPLHTVTAGPKENPAGAAHAMGVVEATLSPMWEHGRFFCEQCSTNFGVNDYESNTVTCPKCGNTGIDTIRDFLQDGGSIEAPIITEHANASSARSMPADEPMRTQCANVKGGHFAIASATLIQTGYGERKGQEPRVPGLDKPLGTVVGGGCKHAAVTAFLAKHYGGNETPGSALDQPADTITAKDHNALVAVNVVRHFGESVGSAATEPVGSTTVGGGGKTGIVTSHLSKLYGTATGQRTDEPLHTVTSGGNHIAEVRAFLVKYYGTGGQDQSLADPMHTIRTRDSIGLVMVAGEEYVITDIGMRMLEPRELFNAQGFPPYYIINVGIGGKRLPKHAQVRMCGNSVPPPMSKALVAANLPELSLRRPRRKAA